MPSAVLVIRILADASKAAKELDKTSQKTSKWGKASKVAGVAAGAGLAALAGFAIGGAKAAADDAQQQVVLAKALKLNANATDASVASTEDWIAKTALATGTADDQLRPALATLARATGDTEQAQKDLTTALDISAATGADVESVSKAIAKGYSGSTGALQKLVPGMDKATLAGKDMTKIMGEVNSKVGGTAAAAAGTAAGQFQRMKVAVGETQESLGTALLPAISLLLGLLTPLLSTLSQNTTLVKTLALVFAALAGAVLAVSAATKVVTAATTAYSAATKTASFVTKVFTAVSKALKLAWATNPIGLIVLALVALVAIFIVAYKKVGWFRAGVDAAMRFVLAAVKAVWNWLKKNWPLLLVILTGPIGAAALLVIKNIDKIKAAFKVAFNAVKGFIQPVIDAMHTLWDWVKKVLDLIGKIKIPKLPDLNPFSRTAPAPGATTTTTVAGLTRGPAQRTVSTGNGGPTFYIYGALDPQQTARNVQRLLHTADIRAGRKRFA